MTAHQIEYDASLIRTQSRKNEDAFIEAGKLVDIGCSAIVATNTMMTHDVLNCLEQRGIKPNEDIAIGGFVDSYLGKRFAKSIPVVFEPIEELGDLAGEAILEKINSPDKAFPIKHIPCYYCQNK
jgi:DNA-binding LacI/PurR family transcriptional regulator